MVVNTYHNARPRFVLVYHISRDANGAETGREPLEMHTADAERVIREFPSEWSRLATPSGEPAPVEPTPVDRLAELERDLRDLQGRLAATRRELAGPTKS